MQPKQLEEGVFIEFDDVIEYPLPRDAVIRAVDDRRVEWIRVWADGWAGVGWTLVCGMIEEGLAVARDERPLYADDGVVYFAQ